MPEAQIVYEDEKNKYYALATPFRYYRSTFWQAGLDTLAVPPTQNEDSFTKLDNIQPVTKGILERRWGYATFNTPPFVATRLVEYQSDATGVRRILLADDSTIASINEDGTNDNTNILAIGATPRIIVSRDWAFVVDNQLADLKKLGDASGTWSVANWGIAKPQTASGPFAQYAGTVASSDFSNPTFAEGAPDNNFATDIMFTHGSGFLTCTNYSLAVPSTTTITGVKVTVRGFATSLAHYSIRLIVAGSSAGATQTATLPIGTSADTSFGGASYLWNTTLSPSQMNASNTGVTVSVANGAVGANTISIDAVEITVYTNGGTALTVGTPGAGDITLSVGRQYFYVYRNSGTGHISDLSNVSASTGPLTSKNVPLSNIIASPDSQVDFIDILATADGGDQTLLYYLDSISNGTTTYTDDVPEATLLLNTTYLETDQFGNEIGVADNGLPPTATTGIKHRGRIYLANGQYLYFSKSLGELTTSTGFIAGRYEEAWPADYVMDISAGAETIRGILSDGMILYIGTERHIRRLIGDGPLNFTKPDVTFAEVGVLNQEVWKVVYHEGMPTGVIWITPDFRVIWSDFNTYRDISPPIQGNAQNMGFLKDINQSAAATACRAEIFTSGPYDFYMLAIPTGSNTVADTLLIFNLKTQQWFRWLLADLTNAILFNVTADGVPQLLFAANTTDIYRFGTGLAGIPLATQDRVGGTPVNITSTIQTTWLGLGDMAMRKALNNLRVLTQDTAGMTCTIEAASNPSEFIAPYTVVSARTFTPDAYSDYRIFPVGEKARKHYYRYTFISTSADTQVLNGFAQEVYPVHKF